MAALAVATHPTVDAARDGASVPTDAVLVLCVEHHGWLPLAVRPVTRLEP